MVFSALKDSEPGDCYFTIGPTSYSFSAVSLALYTRPTRHLFRLFFGCFQGPAFGASAAGRPIVRLLPIPTTILLKSLLSGLQEAERDHVECQNKFFDSFRAGHKTSNIVKKCQTYFSEISGRGRWKRGICINLSEFDFGICDNFAHPSCDVRNEIPSMLRKFGAQFAANIVQRPPYERPLLGIYCRDQKYSGSGKMLPRINI